MAQMDNLDNFTYIIYIYYLHILHTHLASNCYDYQKKTSKYSQITKKFQTQANGLLFTISFRHFIISSLVTGIGLLSKCPRSGMITSAA
jgi:NurA-like 5'-3' nuclease